MKKFTGLLLAAVLCLPAYAAQTKNTMKMVSYFPVPYVAYDTVSANNAMDIGILNQCAMDINKGSTNLGGSACSLYLYGNATGADLNRGLLNVAAGKLDLNSNVANARIVSKKVQIGKDMTTIGGWLDIGLPSGKAKDYDALYISSLKNTGSSFRVTSKENGAKVNSFHMFNEISNDFPGCAGTVTWQELELAANVNNNETYTDIYLVCGGTASEPEDPEECQPPRGNSYTESCPEGQEGNITFTWQGEPVCNYKETNNCGTGCHPTKGQSYTENCPSGQSGTITYTWAQSSCSYKKTENCIVGDCSDSYYKATHKAECCPGTLTTDIVCWTPGPLRWSHMQTESDSEAIFRCNQKNMYTPHSTCSISCAGKSSVNNSYCASVSGPCSNYGEVCEMQVGYCPIFTGTYNNGKPNCNCTGGEVLGRAYKVCSRDYLKNGW